MEEFGLRLSAARRSRGLSLEDAERTTRISKRFLAALEESDYTVFPAPVYARGFLRTYCRFLDLDPSPELGALPPAAQPFESPLPPAPHLRRRGSSWLAGAVVAAFLLLATALFLLTSRGDSPAAALEGDEVGAGNGEPELANISDTPPGVMPDLAGVPIADALAFLDEREISYLVIEAPAENGPAGVVIGQAPEAGAAAVAGDEVTLTVSSGGASAAPARTDCVALAVAVVRSEAEQAWYAENCVAPPPAALPDRNDCEEIRDTAYRSPQEREFFLANCIIS